MEKKMLDIENGKYTIIREKSGGLHALRYGEPWRDITGDNLIYFLMCRVIELEEKLKS